MSSIATRSPWSYKRLESQRSRVFPGQKSANLLYLRSATYDKTCNWYFTQAQHWRQQNTLRKMVVANSFQPYSLRRNPSGNWVILVFSGEKPCARKMWIISHSLFTFSYIFLGLRAMDIINNYSLKSRWIVAKYLPSRESGEVNIPKATIHRDWEE